MCSQKLTKDRKEKNEDKINLKTVDRAKFVLGKNTTKNTVTTSQVNFGKK